MPGDEARSESQNTMKTFRRIVREAVIFTLLGPVAVVGYYIAVEIYNAPPRAPYTIAPAGEPQTAAEIAARKARNEQLVRNTPPPFHPDLVPDPFAGIS